MRLRLILCFLLILLNNLFCQQNAIVSLLTANDGLSQGMIFDMLQSKDGFIWIATKDGLNRYDGSRFRVFSPDPFNPFAIGNSEVHELFEDSRGWIWIGLPDGMDILDPASGKFYHLKHEGKPFQTGSIVETKDGTLWIAAGDNIWKIIQPNELLTKALKQGNANVELPCQLISMAAVKDSEGGKLESKMLLLTKEDKVLVGTNHGLFQLNLSTEQIVPELPSIDCDIQFLVESDIGEILMMGAQAGINFWVEISNGKVLNEKKNSSNNYVAKIFFDNNGYFWTYDHNTRAIQKWSSSKFFNKGEPELEIASNFLSLGNNQGYACTDFIVDKSGIVWTGTSGYGIVKINEKGQKFKTVLPKTAHRLLFEDSSGALYTASLPTKKFLSKSFDQSEPNTELPLDRIQVPVKLTYDHLGNMWWLDGNQIFKKNPGSKSTTSFPFEGCALICNRNGKLCSVDENGLHIFNPESHIVEHFLFEKKQKILSGNSYYLYEDKEEVIWIFGFEGLIKATPIKNEYQFINYVNDPTDPHSLSINQVLSVCDDPLEPHRYLWVGTKGAGLNRLDKETGKFKKYGKEEGLPDNVVYGILAQDHVKENQSSGYIWLSTNKGLCRFDVRTETSKNFTVADGLQDNEFNAASYMKTRDGYMIFGGVNGINVFYPDSLNFNKNIPQIQIVGLAINNHSVDLFGKNNISLSYDQNQLTFDFAALEYTNPTQNQYRYQLLGVSKDWIFLGNKNSIQFANLAPGDYTFKVEGSNNDGTWCSQPAQLHFRIYPPFWASWWAYILYFIGLMWILFAYYKYKLNQKSEQQENAKLREMDEFKSRFFANITHEIRTPLTVILGMSDQLVMVEKDQNVKKKLSLIKRNGDNLLRLVNQILDLSKLESNTLKLHYIKGDILTYIKYIVESLHSFANAQNILLKVESNQVQIEMDYDPERILQIMYNLLSNAIKFTSSGGKVILTVNQVGHWLQLSVSDTGSGIANVDLPFIFERYFQAKNQEHSKASGTGIGLSLTNELVKAMGGQISVESTVGLGTTFIVKLPITLLAKKETSLEFDFNEIQNASSSAGISKIENFYLDRQTNKNETIANLLLIEDNTDVVEYLTSCLQRKYNLDFAFNGEAGIEKALTDIPDIIISDVMMPMKDGFQVLEQLKQDDRTSHIPIILLTAKADVESRMKGLRWGADAYISKPFHQEELLITLDNLLEVRRKLQIKYQQGAIDTIPDKTLESSDSENAFLQKFRTVVEKNLSDTDFEMPQLERALSMSRSQIYRKIKALTDKSPSLLIRSIRLHHGRNLLLTTQLSVSEIAYQVGYSAVNNFSDAYLEEFGERPMKTRGRND